ncbi:MAG: hypothetical protein J6J87_05470 [Oscillospiraceae bacterium]|nr:hypothetical protein [Oscillospiraceae bacterium]
MMIVFGILIVMMMLLCVAAAAGVFPNAWSRRKLEWFWNKKPGKLLLTLEQALAEEKHKTA